MQIIEITESEYTESQGLSSKGKRVKAWYERNSDGKVFLYKEPKKRQGFITFEIWTEIIAYHVGNTLGLNVPAAFPAKVKDSYGVLIENFLSKEGDEQLFDAKELFSGSDLFNPLVNCFDKGCLKQMHNIALIEKYFKNTCYGLIESCWINYIKMLVFDCLIGNNDRHDENWGFCSKVQGLGAIETFTIRFSPIYDNAC